MDRDHEPELNVSKSPDLGEQWRARREEHGQEARRRYIGHLAPVLARLGVKGLPDVAAAAVLDTLCRRPDIANGEACRCSCHPRLPETDFHDYGFGCVCRQTSDQRRVAWDEWWASMEEFWSSPEGRRRTAAHRSEDDELHRWLGAHPGIEVVTHGGAAPEQWEGTVDGHTFYFRERHDRWRIEVDLRPSGRFDRVWKGAGDLADDDDAYELRETEEGDVIAEGTTSAGGYGDTPVERVQFIAGHVRGHFRRLACRVHLDEADDLAFRFGRPLGWCPACGARLLDGG